MASPTASERGISSEPELKNASEVSPEDIARITHSSLHYLESGAKRIDFGNSSWIHISKDLGMSLLIANGAGQFSLRGTVALPDEEHKSVSWVKPVEVDGNNRVFTWATVSKTDGISIHAKTGLQLDLDAGDGKFRNAAFRAKRQLGLK